MAGIATLACSADLPPRPQAPAPQQSGGLVDCRLPQGYMRNMMTPAGDPLPILIAPDPMLKTRARPVAAPDAATVRGLVPRMLGTMYRAPGIGLAAPQVGIGLRLTVIDLMPHEKPSPIVLVNPEVVAASKELATREEGCLSLPGQYADVTRPAWVKVRYLDEIGAKQEIEADGLLAACLQHEIDHLNGILFVDHLSNLKRNMILRRLAKELRQKREEASAR
jgi:peptide deformylase